jgi:hypothetical protein|tara:strand:- start:24561 stop:24782 length:222 start_codon:yes stop_codon:yes gene_type:complete
MNHIPGKRFKIIKNNGQHPKFKLGNIYDIATMRKIEDEFVYYFRNLTEGQQFSIPFPSIEDADKFINSILVLT